MKILLFIILIVIAVIVIHYLQILYAPPSSPCPSGSTYVRSTLGKGWAETDPSDPFGTCIYNSEINAALNQ